MSRRSAFEGLLVNALWTGPCLSFGRRHAAHGTSAGDIAGGELCLDLLEPKMPCGACDLALTQDDQVGAKGRQICHLSVRMGSGEDLERPIGRRLGGARLLNDLAGFEAVRDGNDQVIGEGGGGQ